MSNSVVAALYVFASVPDLLVLALPFSVIVALATLDIGLYTLTGSEVTFQLLVWITLLVGAGLLMAGDLFMPQVFVPGLIVAAIGVVGVVGGGL